jgi:hypothetical protein
MITLIDDKKSGLVELFGKRVTFFGVVYIYTGVLVAIDKSFAKLENAAIVYETGAFTDPKWKDAQPLPHPVYVKLGSIESVMVLK